MNREAFSGMQKALSNIKHLLVNSNIGKRVLVLLPGIASFAFVVIFMLTFNVTVATAVSYNGKTIGYVSSETVYTDTIKEIKSDMDDKAKAELEPVDAKESITAGTKLMDKDDLEKAIVNSISSVDSCFVLYRNSVPFAVLQSSDEINIALSNYLDDNSKKLEKPSFADDFEIKKEYRTYDTIIGGNELYNKLKEQKVAVCGTKTETVTKSIPYKTVTKKSSKYNKGEKVIIKSGKKGKRTINQEVYYNNGKKVETKVLSSKVIKKPQNEVVLIGTAHNSFSLSYPFAANYPITSPYGDYRGYYYHQGIDIVAPYGTEILASAGGTVVEASYSYYGWGNHVVIDHGNGMKTRYAHCSSLNVSVGDKVARGEVIAFVGSTGDADCNHLHIELLSGGARINAANYFIN